MKYSPFFWPSLLFGGIFDDDFFGKEFLNSDSKLLGNDVKSEENEDGYTFDFLGGVDVDADGIDISVEDGFLKVEYDKSGDNQEIHFKSVETLPEDADIKSIEAYTDGTGFSVKVKKLPPVLEEPKKALAIPVKVVEKPEE